MSLLLCLSPLRLLAILLAFFEELLVLFEPDESLLPPLLLFDLETL